MSRFRIASRWGVFTEDDLAGVRAATREAESRTGAEIVCVIVERCDVYEEARWKAATLGALAAVLGAVVWAWTAEAWSLAAGAFALLTLAGAGMGWTLAWIFPPLARALVPAAVLAARAARSAAAAFLEEGVSGTRDRSGVLLFLTLFERRVEVVADTGIAARVPAEAWAGIARRLAEGLRRRQGAGAALVAAVEACGWLLAQHGVPRRPDDVDELSDEPRLRE